MNSLHFFITITNCYIRAYFVIILDYLKFYNIDDDENNFTKLVNYCRRQGDKFGTKLIDYANLDIDLLECYLNIAMPTMSTVHFKDMMSNTSLSTTVTIGEEAFAILVFENNFKRWIYQAEEQKGGGELREECVPDVLYQQKVKKRKDNRDTAGRWTDEGMERLNFFIRAVREYRSDEGEGVTREAVEAELKQRCEMENNGQSEFLRRRKRRLERTRDDEQIVTKRVVVENMLNLTEI